MSIDFRNALAQNPNLTAKEFCKVNTGEGRAKQEFKNECDINFILNKYQKTGIMPLSTANPVYADVDVMDFQESMNKLIEAEKTFNALPAKLRKELDNDPINLIKAVQSDEGKKLLDQYGMLKKEEPEKIVKVQVTNPPPETP